MPIPKYPFQERNMKLYISCTTLISLNTTPIILLDFMGNLRDFLKFRKFPVKFESRKFAVKLWDECPCKVRGANCSRGLFNMGHRCKGRFSGNSLVQH